MGQYCFAGCRLSSSVPLPAGGPAGSVGTLPAFGPSGGWARGRSVGPHGKAVQSCCVPLWRHLVQNVV